MHVFIFAHICYIRCNWQLGDLLSQPIGVAHYIIYVVDVSHCALANITPSPTGDIHGNCAPVIRPPQNVALTERK